MCSSAPQCSPSTSWRVAVRPCLRQRLHRIRASARASREPLPQLSKTFCRQGMRSMTDAKANSLPAFPDVWLRLYSDEADALDRARTERNVVFPSPTEGITEDDD